jgi:thiamine-monophosphate kinase
VLAGGDDYELLFTAPPAARAAIEALAAPLGLPLSRVGSIQAGAPRLQLLDAQGRAMRTTPGFDHFA